jgi:hypothetical protein
MIFKTGIPHVSDTYRWEVSLVSAWYTDLMTIAQCPHITDLVARWKQSWKATSLIRLYKETRLCTLRFPPSLIVHIIAFVMMKRPFRYLCTRYLCMLASIGQQQDDANSGGGSTQCQPLSYDTFLKWGKSAELERWAHFGPTKKKKVADVKVISVTNYEIYAYFFVLSLTGRLLIQLYWSTWLRHLQSCLICMLLDAGIQVRHAVLTGTVNDVITTFGYLLFLITSWNFHRYLNQLSFFSNH